MTLGQRLDQLVASVDLAGLEEWLLGASADELRGARSWYAAARADLGRLHVFGGELWESLREERRAELPWLRAILAGALLAPVAAAEHIPWTEYRHRDSGQPWERLLRVVRSRGETWVGAFAPAAARHGHGRPMYEIVRSLVVDYGLPIPDSDAFLQQWLVTYWWIDEDATTDRLTEDPLMPEMFHRLVASGDLGRAPGIAAAAARLVESGLLERERVVAQGLDVLTTQQPAAAQRVLARLMQRLDVTETEIPGGLPFMQGLIATCHGSVGAWLLPIALGLVETPAELAELGATIAGRPERAQKATLVRALAGTAVQARVGPDAVLDVLAVFREISQDQKLLAQVDTLAARLGGTARTVAEPDPEPSGLWDLAPPGERFVSPRVGEWPGINDDVARGLAYELRHGETHARPDTGVIADLLLAAIVRQGWASGGPRVRAEFEGMVERVTGRRGTLGEALVDWCADPGVESYRAAHARAGEPRFTQAHYLAQPYSLNVPADAFRHLLARESLLRLGRSACLLSTPSHGDHSISFAALVPRIELCQGSSVGPMDLLQTLLRLRPTDPGELHRLEGMVLPVDETVSPRPEPTGVRDGLEVLRAWVLAGGLPPLQPSVSEVDPTWGHARWVSDAVLPIPEGLLAAAPRGFLNDDPARYPSDEVVRIVPRWPDRMLWSTAALDTPRAHSQNARLRTIVLGREAALDLPAYDAILHAMVCTDGSQRADAARLALDLMAEGRFDTDRFARAALARLEAGVLMLARVTAVWELVTTAGGLRLLWPAMLRVGEAACAATRRPAGTADLLRALSRLLPEVPEADVPPAIRGYAESKGSTKAHHEARRLVSTADRRSAA